MKGYFIYIIGFLLLLTNPLKAAEPEAIWLIIDQTTASDISYIDTPNLDYLQKKGAFGLMNVRTAGLIEPESTYLTVGAGKRCKGSKYSHEGENNGQGVINPRIQELIAVNENNSYNPRIGLMGKLFRENGVIPAVLGNTDSGIKRKRTVISLAMDEKGIVPYGNVGREILEESDKYWTYCTDWESMKNEFQKFRLKTDIIFIETGDMTRIEDFSDQLTLRQKRNYKKRALRKIDIFIGYLLENIDISRTQLGLIVPTPPSTALKKGHKLSWLLIAGDGLEHGWLTSRTTRRMGIVTITDLLPTFLNSAGVGAIDNKFRGALVTSIKADVNWTDLIEKNEKISIISNLRSPFIRGFIGFQLVIIILAIVSFYYHKPVFTLIFKYTFTYLLLAILLIPFNFLLISLFSFARPVQYFILLLIMTPVELYILNLNKLDRLDNILIIVFSLLTVIIYDLFTGYHLMADSLLGYSSIIGARYYGLGNEYMGLFIGGSLIGISGILERLKRVKGGGLPLRYSWLSAGFLLLITYCVGAANLGANFGGMITAGFTGIITWFYMWKNKICIRKLIMVSLVFLIMIIFLVIVDYYQLLGVRTHIGNALKPIITGDWGSVKEIIVRKISMNLKLLRWTIWTRVLLAFILYLLFLFRHPVGIFRDIISEYNYLSAGFYSALLGAVITLVVNDSGVVASATMLFFPMMTLLYLLEKNSNINTGSGNNKLR